LDELINIGFVIFGGFIGSSIITLFPYFMDKGKLETRQAEIYAKPEATRTPEEQYLLTQKPRGFFEEYKYRFTFGLISGIGITLAFVSQNISTIGTYTSGAAVIAGLTASGFMSALADKIRAK